MYSLGSQENLLETLKLFPFHTQVKSKAGEEVQAGKERALEHRAKQEAAAAAALAAIVCSPLSTY